MKKLLYLFLLPFAAALGACNNDDGEKVGLPDITVSFVSSQTSFENGEQSEEITLSLSRISDLDITATIEFEGTGVEYATHFTTAPAPIEGKISVTIPAGGSSASFTVTKAEGIILEGDETVEFTISSLSVTEKVTIGDKASTILEFGAIVSTGQAMILEGNGTENNINSVYVDLSTNRQTSVDRKSWNIGFWCGEEFRVVLNSAYMTAAVASGKTNIDEVDLALASAVEDSHNINTNPMMGVVSQEILDAADGSLTGTVFAEVSATENDNEVYFVASEDDKDASRENWYKVRVNRKGEGYSVQFARVGDDTYTTVDIPKNGEYNLVLFSLADGEILETETEPRKGRWDIRWSYDTGTSVSQSKSLFLQDYVAINNYDGVQSATVMTADIAYDDFAAADIAALTFNGDRDAIGETWRNTMPPGMGGGSGEPQGVRSDRYYVIKDASEIYYKLRFTKMGFNDDGTERGRPGIEYRIVE